jgi:hypothetical protein
MVARVLFPWLTPWRITIASPPTGDHKGPPICIKLRKEEVKRSKGEPAFGERIEREKI